MTEKKSIRGADVLARSLDTAGLRTIFTLSGNHIMPVFDAALGTGLELIHVRHEAAAVHMADGWARLTGQCGIALVTGGAGHTNAVAALCTAQAADAPLVLLSGHAGLKELGRGAFQELAQAEMAAPVTKASWVVQSAALIGHDLAKAVRIAASGRPGPVHLSLPVDLLDEKLTDLAGLWPAASEFAAVARQFSTLAADAVLRALVDAERPLILAGPMLCHAPKAALQAQLAEATGVPVIGMESPRGINDPRHGALAEVLASADLIVLLGKPHDFTLRFAEPPAVARTCRLIVIDPDPTLIERAAREKEDRVVLVGHAEAAAAAGTLIARAGATGLPGHTEWSAFVRDATAYRPPGWATVASTSADKLHPVAMCRAIAPHLTADAVLVCDGGEIGQWAQAVLDSRRRLINGVAGSIGSSIPMAIAASAACKRDGRSGPVIAVLGDGTFGFHMAEFDTAVRYGLPFVAVVGNDAGWNAEHQIQLREYGRDRTHGCELLPTRYDRVAEALGGHGELVQSEDEMAPALARAIASGKPACVNVLIERVAAPVVRRPA